MRITTVVLGTILAALAVWYFFPGILDPESTSIFASKKRTSPIARAVGPRVIANGTKTVAEDEYVGLNVRLNSPSTLRVSVNQSRGPKFEVYVMSREGYQEFDRAAGNLFGGRFHHYESMAGVVELTKPYDNSERLPAGDYVVLLDNSDFGDTMPPMNFSNDTVVARVKVVAQ